MFSKKLHIGLTGGIGSGKSAVSRILYKQFGFTIIDADLLTLEAYRMVQPDLVGAFGDGILDELQCIDKKRLSRIVFGHPEHLCKLNAIMHPAMTALAQKKITQSDDPIILDAALLFEAGWQSLVQKTIVVTAPIKTRIQRICQRDGVSPEYAAMRIASQMPDAERLRKADIVIYNISSLKDLKLQCLHIFGDK